LTTRNQIKYIDEVKYSLVEDYEFYTRIRPPQDIHTFFIDLFKDGRCVVRRGYAWDGPSGPTVDTPDSMRASLEHDVKYELLRKGLIETKWRDIADKEFHETCLFDGMNQIRAEAWYLGVHEFAEYAANPKNKKKILTAP